MISIKLSGFQFCGAFFQLLPFAPASRFGFLHQTQRLCCHFIWRNNIKRGWGSACWREFRHSFCNFMQVSNLCHFWSSKTHKKKKWSRKAYFGPGPWIGCLVQSRIEVFYMCIALCANRLEKLLKLHMCELFPVCWSGRFDGRETPC